MMTMTEIYQMLSTRPRGSQFEFCIRFFDGGVKGFQDMERFLTEFEADQVYHYDMQGGQTIMDLFRQYQDATCLRLPTGTPASLVMSMKRTFSIHMDRWEVTFDNDRHSPNNSYLHTMTVKIDTSVQRY